MAFHEVMPLDELWRGDKVARTVAGVKVLLIRNDDAVYAYEDRCAHLGVSLSDGTLEGDVLTCSAHHYKYDARTGRGINPRSVGLRPFPVKISGGSVWVDVPSTAPTAVVKLEPSARRHGVGPVLETGELADAIVVALRETNPGLAVENRGSYLRVLAPSRCRLERVAVERALGRPFHLPGDLELCMVSFKGKLSLDEDQAVWAFGEA